MDSTSFGAQDKPMVSVIIPAYNSSQYIAEALKSVLAQTFSSFEVIVINDGSPDTDQLEREIKPYLDRTVYLKQQNKGPSAARNKGIRQAQGEFVAFLDSDDSWLPEYLAEQIKLFEQNPGLVIVASDTRLFGDSPLSGKTFYQLYPPKLPPTFAGLLSGDCSIVTSCTVVRKQAAIEAGLFDEAFIRAEDFDLWLRVTNGGGGITIHQKVLARRRLHPNALTVAAAKVQADEVRVLAKLEKMLELTPEARAALQYRLARGQAFVDLERGKQYVLLGQRENATELLTKAQTFFRSTKLRLVIFGLQVAPRLTTLGAKIWQQLL